MSQRTEQTALPPGLRRLIATATALALPIVAWAAVRTGLDPPGAGEAFAVTVFLGLALLAEFRPVALDEDGRGSVSRGSVSLAFVFILAGLILFGWEVAVGIATISSLVAQLVDRKPLVRTTYNSSVYALSAFAAGFPLLVLNVDSVRDPIFITAVAIWSGAAFVVVNVLLVSLVISLHERVPFGSLLREEFRLAGPAFVIQAFLAALAAALWVTDPVLLVLMAGPLFTVTLYQRTSLASRIARRDAHTDSLTRLGNTRAYELGLASAVEEAAGSGAALSLCLADIDDFKQINDMYGHQAGDAALEEVARLLMTIAEGTSAYRLGGDEFALLIPADRDDTCRYLEGFYRGVPDGHFPHGAPVSVSVGVATFPDQATSAEQLEHMADGALYWAKHNGKNQWCAYGPEVVRLYSSDELDRRAEHQARLRAAENLVRVVDAKDEYTGAHSERVALLVGALARRLGVDEKLVAELTLAGRLHDVGKIAISDQVLQKPSALNPDEQRQILAHPELGASLLDGMEIRPVDAWIRHHHEHWDGSGYPHGLRGEEIPFGSRVILVADAYDALTTDRSYRSAVTPLEALEELNRMAGVQFDPAVVTVLEAHLKEIGLIALRVSERTESRGEMVA